MTATVIDFRAAVERRFARDMALRAIQSIRVSPADFKRGEHVMILGTEQRGRVLRVEEDGRVWVRLNMMASTLVPADRVVRLDGPKGAA